MYNMYIYFLFNIHYLYIKIIGTPIKCPRINKPTQADIDKYHAIYCKELIAMFDRNKFRFGMDNVQLPSFFFS